MGPKKAIKGKELEKGMGSIDKYGGVSGRGSTEIKERMKGVFPCECQFPILSISLEHKVVNDMHSKYIQQ